MIYHIKSTRKIHEKTNSGHTAVQGVDHPHLKLTQGSLGTCWHKASCDVLSSSLLS